MSELTSEQMSSYFSACSQSQSDYALEHLVVGAQLTPARMFRQAVMELNVCQSGLRQAEYDLEMKKIESEEAQALPANTKFDERRRILTIAKIQHELEDMERMLGGQRKTMNTHLNLVIRHREELGLDEGMTSEQVASLLESKERDWYTLKLSMDVAADMVARSGGPPVGTNLSIQHLPPEDIERVRAMVSALVPKLSGTQYTEALHSDQGLLQLEQLGKEAIRAAEIKSQHKPQLVTI